jgi:hypothetical protein
MVHISFWFMLMMLIYWVESRESPGIPTAIQRAVFVGRHSDHAPSTNQRAPRHSHMTSPTNLVECKQPHVNRSMTFYRNVNKYGCYAHII